MNGRRKLRDNALIDILEETPAVQFEGRVWRVVRAERDPLRGSASGGRWDDGTFEVLYTSIESDGALAEQYFHLMRGQPVFPSRIAFRLYELTVSLRRALRLAVLDSLQPLGIEAEAYGAMTYQRRQAEYRRTQEIGEVAHFLDFDGLIVPSARWACLNLILFTDRVAPDSLGVEQDHGDVDWEAWNARTKDL